MTRPPRAPEPKLFMAAVSARFPGTDGRLLGDRLGGGKVPQGMIDDDDDGDGVG